MGRIRNVNRGSQLEARLDPPGMVPTNADIINPGGALVDRTCRLPLAPDTEKRIMLADRAHVAFTPGAQYANTDRQIGGAPGRGVITSQTEEGATVVGGVPMSPLKLSTGWADWASVNPYPSPSHGKISRRSNPNAAQTTIGIWANEGTPSNTNYEQTAPWAAGIYIG